MKSWSFRHKAVTTVTAVFLLGMGVCIAGLTEQPESIERTRIAGTWTGDAGARVELHANGRFEMSGIPRSAITFSFIDPPPGDGKLSGSGTWKPARDGDRVDSILLYVDAGGSFSETSETGELGVAESGENPVLYFSTSPDKWYGYEIRKTGT
ncbi:hypothetical protein [Streptomyces sp. NBC_01353]|uniref:hypothetical protein n=1 Tax=Streptomyces sp. NBC_01353 TaxID=2903835 RepID=UPI002E34BC52|nr:hypothetical protein [Streptomyces sp. NBC_01353]